MKHNYSFVETLNYIKSTAPKYEFRKPIRLDAYMSEIMPIQSGSFKFGLVMNYLHDIQTHFGIRLEHRKNLHIETVRDLVIAVHKLSHDKIK